MAETDIPQGNPRKSTGIRKLIKQSTRVDLTPMVDLGFLLITFFIFTTTMSQPKAINLVLPPDAIDPMPVPQSGALTILLGSNGSAYYYEGDSDKFGSNLHGVTLKQLRDEIIRKKLTTRAEDLFIILKPGKESVYKDVVNALDEMTINDVMRYALVDITAEEEALIDISGYNHP